MSVRRVIFAVLRGAWVAAGVFAVGLAISYVLLTTPPGMRWLANTISRQVSAKLGWQLAVGLLDTDFHSYLMLRQVTLSLPKTGTRLSVDRLHVRLSLWKILNGELHGLRSVSLDSLMVTLAPGRDTVRSREPSAWSIAPMLPYAPDWVDVRGVVVRLPGAVDTSEFSIATVNFRSSPSLVDSSLLVALNLSGNAAAGALGLIPFSGNGHLFFRGPSLRVGGLLINGPGVVARGSADVPDLLNGPYYGTGSLHLELDGLPRRASGLALSGSIEVRGSIGWRGQPDIAVTIESPKIITPWAGFSDARFYLTTQDSILALRGNCRFADGDIGISARMPVPPRTGQLRFDIALLGAVLDSVAGTPVVSEALGGAELAGRLSARWRYTGRVTRRAGQSLQLVSTRMDLTLDSLRFAAISLGKVAGYWSQDRRETTGALTALGAHLAVSGTVHGAGDVNLRTSLRAPHADTLLRAVGVRSVDAALSVLATVRGSLASPHAELRADARDIRISGMRTADLSLFARVFSPDTVTMLLKSADSRIWLDATLLDRFTRIGRLNAKVGPWPISELPGRIAEQYNLDGSFSVRVSGAGPLAAPHFRAALSTTPISWERQSVGKISGEAKWEQGSLSFEAQNADTTLLVRGTVASDSAAQSHITATWERFQLGSILAALTKQDISEVAGVSDGTITLRWRRGLPQSFAVAARLERAEVRLGNITYNIKNPPARFTLAQGMLMLPSVTLQGANQRLFVEGRMSQNGSLNFTVALDSVDLHNIVVLATAGKLNVRGTLAARMHLTGTVTAPIIEGYVGGNMIRWRSLAVDSLGAHVFFRADTVSVTDYFADFPSGSARGAFTATTPALGLSPFSPEVKPRFSASLRLDHAGATIPNWEGLRGGKVELTGALDVAGKRMADIRSFRGVARIDSISVVAPFSRSMTLVQPTVVRIGNRIRPLAGPLSLQLRYRGAPAGRITIAHPPDSTVHGVSVEVSRLSLENMRHVALPLLNALKVTAIPSDLSGILSLSTWWNMDPEAPEADIGLHLRDLTAAGIHSDSLLFGVALRGGTFSLKYGRIFSGGDTITVAGSVSPASDTLQLSVRSRRLELVELLEDILPPLRRYEPPPPLPTTMPTPGYGQQVQYLPPDAQGKQMAIPLTVFDRLMRKRGRSLRHPYAATLPIEMNVDVHGTLSAPRVNGKARLLGAYLEMESVVEPFWVPDTVLIRFTGSEVSVPPTSILVGAEKGGGTSDRRIDLERARFSFEDGSFAFQVRVNRTTFTVISTEPVIVPPKLRLFRSILQPLLTSYYTDPVGAFTLEGHVDWKGTPERSRIVGDVQLYASTFQYPIAKPAALLAPPAPTSYGPMLDNAELLLNVSTEDSLVINNNLSDHASLWAQMTVSGHLNNPQLQGRVELSPGSRFRYLGRDFVVEQATIDFPDPARFAPIMDIRAKSYIGDPETSSEADPTYFMVSLTASGTFPNLVKTEMSAVANPPDGEVIVNQLQIMQILVYGKIPQNYLAFDATSRLNNYLKERGYATLSAALGSVIPVDRVTVHERGAANPGANPQSGVEVEVAQSFRFLGQRISVTAAAGGQLSSINNLQRVEVRWMALNRPKFWRPMESLSLTLGQNRTSESHTAGDIFLQNELTADVQLRIRFR